MTKAEAYERYAEISAQVARELNIPLEQLRCDYPFERWLAEEEALSEDATVHLVSWTPAFASVEEAEVLGWEGAVVEVNGGLFEIKEGRAEPYRP